MPDELARFDAARLIALVRARNPEALSQAYRATFDNELGRLVLADHLSECGVGSGFGPDFTKYAAGKHDGAILLASKAGFDQASMSVAVLSDELEGNTDEPAYNYLAEEPDTFD